MQSRSARAGGWEPTYPVWASSVYVGAIGGTLAASRLAPLIAPETVGWGLPALLRAIEADAAPLPVLLLSLALAFVLISMLPGLTSLFMITVTDLPLGLHPFAGGAFLAIAAGWVTQSIAGAVFGAVFGLVSLGLIVALLTATRYRDGRAR